MPMEKNFPSYLAKLKLKDLQKPMDYLMEKDFPKNLGLQKPTEKYLHLVMSWVINLLTDL